MKWFCINCLKTLEPKGEVADILTDLFQGKNGMGYKLSFDGRPICPDCGTTCMQVEDKEEPENADL
jgi:hypothetical protein